MNKKTVLCAAFAAIAASSLAFAQVSGQAAAPTDLKENGAQRALSFYIIQHNSYLMEKSQTPEQRNAIILACNEARMWTLSPDQKKHEIKHTLELDKFAPGDKKWDSVRNADSMVKALLNTTPDQEAKLEKVFDSAGAEWSRIATSSVPREQKWEQHRQNDLKHLPKFRACLSAEQQKEWDAIVKRADAALVKAYNTRTP